MFQPSAEVANTAADNDTTFAISNIEVSVTNNRKTVVTQPQRQSKRGPQLPEVFSMDVLATMVDEDLTKRFKELDTGLEAAWATHVDTTPWTTELAYVRREQLIRRARREAHDEYLKSQTFNVIHDDDLEPADLDNSAFLIASRG